MEKFTILVIYAVNQKKCYKQLIFLLQPEDHNFT